MKSILSNKQFCKKLTLVNNLKISECISVYININLESTRDVKFGHDSNVKI